MITRFSNNTKIDDPDGSSPTWKKTNDPNDPVAYVKGSNITMFSKITITPSLSSPISVNLRVKSGGSVIATKDNISLSGSQVNVTGITTSSPISNNAGLSTPSFTWELSFDAGSTWSSIGTSGPHTLYWTYAVPIVPPFFSLSDVTYPEIYDLALEKSCGKIGNGTVVHDICASISTAVAIDTHYDPNTLVGGHPLTVYSQVSSYCLSNALLLRGLLRTIGLDAQVIWVYAGLSNGTRELFTRNITPGVPTTPSFQIEVGQNDNAEENPHFAFHAIVKCAQDLDPLNYLDPSYGINYSKVGLEGKAIEVYTGGTPKIGLPTYVHMLRVAPTIWSSDSVKTDKCSHSF